MCRPSRSTPQVAMAAPEATGSDSVRERRSASVKTAIARLGPALLTKGVNWTPVTVAATYTAAIAAHVTAGHLRRTTSGADAITPKPATARRDAGCDPAPSKTGSVKPAKQHTARATSMASGTGRRRSQADIRAGQAACTLACAPAI